MLPRNHPDRIRIAFDDHRLVANAGLLLPGHIGPAPGPAPTAPTAPRPGRCPWPGQLRQQTDDAGGLRPGRRRLHRRRRRVAHRRDSLRSRLRVQGAIHPGDVLLPSFRQTGPLSHGRPLLMAVRGVDSNISNLPTRGAQTASVSEGLFITVQRDVPSGGAAGVLSVQGRADGVGQSVLAPPNSGV